MEKVGTNMSWELYSETTFPNIKEISQYFVLATPGSDLR